MDIKETKRLEHICLKSDLDLKSFGDKFQTVLSLPTMEHDFENETEWLTVDLDGINYNISKPYEEGTLQEWDDETPEGCNIGIVLSIHKDHTYVLDNSWVDKMVANVCGQLAKTFNTIIYHHRTFTFGVDISERKNIVFNP
ncbi:MAG: hypothetical protein V4565_05390 [Bacteroidota bacterium]